MVENDSAKKSVQRPVPGLIAVEMEVISYEMKQNTAYHRQEVEHSPGKQDDVPIKCQMSSAASNDSNAMEIIDVRAKLVSPVFAFISHYFVFF